MNRKTLLANLLFPVVLALPVQGQEAGQDRAPMVGSGLLLPSFDAALGRELFASKGCVVCHSINGIGGEDAQPFAAEYMEEVMNPFEFAARMWRGAPFMIELQEEELGAQIDLTGEELAAIIAFVHDTEEQARFSEEDIPHEIEELMASHDDEEEDDGHSEEEEDDHGEEGDEEEDADHSD